MAGKIAQMLHLSGSSSLAAVRAETTSARPDHDQRHGAALRQQNKNPNLCPDACREHIHTYINLYTDSRPSIRAEVCSAEVNASAPSGVLSRSRRAGSPKPNQFCPS